MLQYNIPKKQNRKFSHIVEKKQKITRLFKETEIRIAFRTKKQYKTWQNHIHKWLQKNGVYQMKCMDCPLKYIGQTSRTLYTRYKEHIQAISNNNSNSGYSSHIWDTHTGVYLMQ
jgi:CRISPR/Cas system CMR-associated protein Cmr5 small subunit